MREFLQTAVNTPMCELTFMQLGLGILPAMLLGGVILFLIVGLFYWLKDKYNRAASGY